MRLLDKFKKKKQSIPLSNNPFESYKIENTLPKKQVKQKRISTYFVDSDNNVAYWEEDYEDDDWLDPIY